MNEETTIKCGYAAVVGRPNVGKSTLLNRILGTKLSIVTAKPQTTRNRVLAVHNTDGAQIIFLDTPGLHTPKGSLGHYMIDAAQSAITDADVCIWMIDAAHPDRDGGLTKAELDVARRLADLQTPTICALNKVDRLKDKTRLLPIIQDVSAMPFVRETIPLSAREGDGVEIFMAALIDLLPQGAPLFPLDMLSDMADRFFVAELVRESLTDMTRQEIPYKAAVVIDQFVEETERCVVHATIHVERASQKGIIIGKGGTMIRDIGKRAREEAEKLLGCPVDLRLHVNVSPDWTKSTESLRKMGYE